jgi:hypothetical protein
MLCVERYGTSNIFHVVADAVDTLMNVFVSTREVAVSDMATSFRMKSSRSARFSHATRGPPPPLMRSKLDSTTRSYDSLAATSIARAVIA